MPRFIRIFPALLLFVLISSCSQPRAQSNMELTGDHVTQIARTFLRNHYSRAKFDDAHSKEMLTLYLNRFDPGRYYFLQSDIDEFRKQGSRLKDAIWRGNIDIAFNIYNRFIQRLKERRKFIAKTLKTGFDLTRDETFQVSRKDAPYPKDNADAKFLFRKKLKLEMLELTLRGQSEEEATESLRKRYRSIHFQYEQFGQNDVVAAFLKAFTSSYDPHSTYLSPDELENFNISMRLSLEGIGATLRWEDGYTVISSIIAGGAAFREGSLQPEDKIISVGEGKNGAMQDVTNRRLIDVVKLIRGHRGTIVRLAFTRRDKGLVEKRHEVSIVRDKIVLKEGEASGEIKEFSQTGGKNPLRFGVITLPSFYVDFSQRNSNRSDFKSASRDVKKILVKFIAKDVDGIILDLRNNGGGGLDEAVKVTGLFINKGPVVLVKDPRGSIYTHENRSSRPIFRGPLVLLINRRSASASEIVAGALQDYGRAILVGDRATFGKGTVQNIHQLSRRLGALKTTIAKFYRPGSSSTQNKGVEADIVLPSMNNHLEIGESFQKNALPWDAVPKIAFRPWGELDEIMPVLREKSRLRISSSEHFSRIKKEVEEYLLHRKNRTSITLNQLTAEIRDSQRNSNESGAKGALGGGTLKDAPEKKDFTLLEAMAILSNYIEVVGRSSGAVAEG